MREKIKKLKAQVGASKKKLALFKRIKKDNKVARPYKPKIIRGTVKGTGWPIDGHTLYFSQWDYDKYESWHLFAWDDADDEAVMETMFITEEKAGLCCYDTLEDFAKEWKAYEWEPQGTFCLELNQVEVLEVMQQEVKMMRKEEKE